MLHTQLEKYQITNTKIRKVHCRTLWPSWGGGVVQYNFGNFWLEDSVDISLSLVYLDISIPSHGTAHVLHSVNMAEPSLSPHVMKLLLKRLPVYLMLYNYLEISTFFPFFTSQGFQVFSEVSYSGRHKLPTIFCI